MPFKSREQKNEYYRQQRSQGTRVPAQRVPEHVPARVPAQPAAADPAALIPGFGGPDCACLHCQQNRRSKHPLAINHGPWLPADRLQPGQVNRQTLPGDPDYVGVCHPEPIMP